MKYKSMSPNLLELPPISLNLSAATFGADDLIFSIAAGSIGAITSIQSQGKLSEVHDFAHENKIYGHENAPCDQVYGRYHRLKFGHDILSPREVFKHNTQFYGGPVKGLAAWVFHLLTDSCSKEGLPFLGSGTDLFREYFKENGYPNYDDYQKYMTIKASDLSGSILVDGLIKVYQLVHSKNDKFTLLNSTTRMNAISLVAHSFCVLGGLTLNPSATSLNHQSLTRATINLMHLMKLHIEDNRNIEDRNNVLDVNAIALKKYGDYLSYHLSFIPENEQSILHSIESRIIEHEHLKIKEDYLLSLKKRA